LSACYFGCSNIAIDYLLDWWEETRFCTEWLVVADDGRSLAITRTC
jgi:hypothetical protein